MARIRLLGPVEVEGPRGRHALSGAGERELLGLLALSAGQVVPTARIADRMWGDALPARPENAIQKRLSRLRAQLKELGLGSGVLVTREPGYLLGLPPSEVDAQQFATLVGEARRLRDSGEVSSARRLLEDALALWRGPALADVPDRQWVTAERVRLDELRLSAEEELIELRLEAGEHNDVLARLRSLVAAEPLREPPRRLLMLALYRAGRQADALALYDETRDLLVEELGIDPTPALRQLHEAILRQEEQLSGPSASGSPSVGRPGASVPERLTSFVGRDRDLAAVEDLLRRTRLVTVTGPGGVGKTSLALEVARARPSAAVVRLGSVSGDDRLPDAVAAQLELLVPGATASGEELLQGHFAAHPAFLVLDNCEHVLDACAPFLHRLLQACPGLQVVATSREALAIPGEVQLALAPLDEDSAVQLFSDRAWAVLPSFSVDDNRDAVVRLCRRLDGMPLAVELAAARVRSLPLRTLVQRLDERFDLLSTRSRTAEGRQQTLKATIDWSHDLLSEPEQVLFRRLGVFRGGLSLDAVEGVCGAPPLQRTDICDLLERLVEKSLVQRVVDADRYFLLTTVHEYALDRLREAREEEATADRHVDWFLRLAEDTKEKIRSAGYAEGTAVLRLEHDNLRAALDRCVATAPADPDRGLRLGYALAWFWYYGLREEGRRYLSVLLADGRGSPHARACALQTLGLVSLYAPTVESQRAARDALAIFEELGDRDRAAESALQVAMEGRYAQDDGEYLALVDSARATLAERGDPWWLAMTHYITLQIHLRRGDHAAAVTEARSCADLLRPTGDEVALAGVLCHLGLALRMTGAHDEAVPVLQEALTFVRPLGLEHNVAFALVQLAHAALDRGDVSSAAPLLEEAFELAARVSNPRLEGWVHLGRARAAQRDGHAERAVESAEEALRCFGDHEYPWVLEIAIGLRQSER